jgi:t-SNARE complex subunit (syntaxin)
MPASSPAFASNDARILKWMFTMNNALEQFETQARDLLAEIEERQEQLRSVVDELMRRVAELQNGGLNDCNYTWADMVKACNFIRTLPHDLIHVVKERVIKGTGLGFTLDPAEEPPVAA